MSGHRRRPPLSRSLLSGSNTVPLGLQRRLPQHRAVPHNPPTDRVAEDIRPAEHAGRDTQSSEAEGSVQPRTPLPRSTPQLYFTDIRHPGSAFQMTVVDPAQSHHGLVPEVYREDLGSVDQPSVRANQDGGQ